MMKTALIVPELYFIKINRLKFTIASDLSRIPAADMPANSDDS